MSAIEPAREWKTVTVDPSRLRSGLWGYDEGDIAASYSADVYGEKKHLRRTFTHAHTPHTAMNVSGSAMQLEAKAYPVVHESYATEIMDAYQASGLSDGYTGKAIRRHGNDCIFGLPVIFRQRPLHRKEIIDLCRRMYAYGGLFAAEAGSYRNLLILWLQQYKDTRIRKALTLELDDAALPQSQAAMREWIQSQQTARADQLTLF